VIKRCRCSTPDPAPLKELPSVEVCQTCRGWTVISGLQTVAELDTLRALLGSNGNYGGTD
jgi:hypothetical protein